jgi:tricarballylate dehydrogenase
MLDVLVIGGGNAALCAAIMAREAGASVMMLESAPFEWRGGNSMHTRNLRCMHDAPQDVLTEAYPEEEYWQDLLKVTGGLTNEALARVALRESATCRDWMRHHGVRFQTSLSGTLHLSRTNAFFLGGGKALVNAYYRSAAELGVEIRYNAQVTHVEIDHSAAGARFKSATVTNLQGQTETVTAKTCVIASGGFESNIAWMREAWGQNADGEWPADNFRIRGTRFNMGVLLKDLLDQGADQIGDPTQCHAVAIDARAPLYDGGICTRVDCVSLGIMVNKFGQRFYDEGEDFWPKRYAIWGRLVAQQPGQIGYSIIDAKAVGRFMPPVFDGEKANTIAELAQKMGLSVEALTTTVNAYNAACAPKNFDHSILDGNTTTGITPVKSNWALPIDTPPFYGYALRPGITFTYLGVQITEEMQVKFNGAASDNIFAAGEIMAGNILGKGYLAGIGMTIGTSSGRIAGRKAAHAATR